MLRREVRLLYGWLGMCAPPRLTFLVFDKKDRVLMLFQTCTKLTLGLSDMLVITVIALTGPLGLAKSQMPPSQT